jgi:hypothetical protein
MCGRLLLCGLSVFFLAILASFNFPSQTDVVELLTKRPWKYDSTLEVKNKDGEWVIHHEFADPCFKDDSLLFNLNGTYEVNAGKIKCESQTQIYKSGTWQLSKYMTMIKMDSYTLQIVTLNESTLQVIRKSGVHESVK